MDDGKVKLVDPLEASRHPFETYLLALAAVSSIPRLFGASNSDAVESALHPAIVYMWSVMLLAGSVLALVGLFWPGRSATGLILERTGLVGVGGAAMIYSTAVIIAAGLGGAFSFCIIAGFGLACFSQARRINKRIHFVMSVVDHS